MAMKWLVVEALIPLLGASVVFSLWGVFLYVATTKKSSFAFAWREALDPLGWLYGAAIFAAQAGWKAHVNNGPPLITVMCGVCMGVCAVVLLAGMHNRGTEAHWKPPASLHLFATFLVAATLFACYRVQLLSLEWKIPND